MTELSLCILRRIDETGFTVDSLEKFSPSASDKDENKLSQVSGSRAENGEFGDLVRKQCSGGTGKWSPWVFSC